MRAAAGFALIAHVAHQPQSQAVGCRLRLFSPGHRSTSIRTALSPGQRQKVRDPHQVNREIGYSRIG
jgi:hypothetical protein